MIQVIRFFKRRPGLAVEEFHERLAAAGDAALRVPGLRGWAESPVIVSGYRRGEPFCDAVVESWWDGVEALRRAEATPEGGAAAAALREIRDEATLGEIVAEEHVVKDGAKPAGGVRNVEFVRRRLDLDVREFHRYWREHHGPLATRIAPILRYVQSHSVEDPAARAWDGIASTWFASTDAMRESAGTAAYAETRADERNFVIEPLAFVITRERVRLEPPARGAGTAARTP